MTSTTAPMSLLVLDDRRGSAAMWLFITTEALLFVSLFFAYYYLGSDAARWPAAEPPKLHYALPMAAILLVSSVVLYWGEAGVERGAISAGRWAVAVTVLLGIAFLMLQALEYREHLRTLTPRSNSYGSIFYLITSFHAAHLVMGLLMLLYSLPLVRAAQARPPHRPLHNTAMYWHFVDLVWIVIVASIYVYPNLDR